MALEKRLAKEPAPTERLTFSIPETAQLLGISRGLAYDLARRGELPTMRFGRRRVVPRAALDALFDGWSK
jgi:excisionase family DNA binding protein